jgi:chromosomal replication initiation ATPase DnaA
MSRTVYRAYTEGGDMEVRDVVKRICDELGNVTVDEVLSKSRVYRIAIARQLVMWYMVRCLRMTLSDVGRLLGKNHTTIGYGVEQIDIVIERNRSWDRKIHDVAEKLWDETHHEN